MTRNDRQLGAWAVQGSGNYRMTAAAVAVFARALVEGQTAAAAPTRGVHGTEDVFEFAQLRDALQRRGIDTLPLL